jgi:hypothetical protein
VRDSLGPRAEVDRDDRRGPTSLALVFGRLSFLDIVYAAGYTPSLV